MGEHIFEFVLDDSSKIDVSPKSMLVFLDETGDEQLKDPQYPIFGFGGCCVLAKDYFNTIDIPWTRMKLEKFGLYGKPLHASGTFFSKEQRTALNNFFLSNTFGRFATISSICTKNETTFNLEQVLFRNFYDRIREIIKWYGFDSIIIIYDNSVRLTPKLNKYASGINIVEKVNDINSKIDTHYCVMNKNLAFSGLEVADFIVHSAGTTLRDLLNGKIRKLTNRKDFSCIFEKIDKKYSSFIKVDGFWHS